MFFDTGVIAPRIEPACTEKPIKKLLIRVSLF